MKMKVPLSLVCQLEVNYEAEQVMVLARKTLS
jgi:hypothetical protein